MGYYDHFLVIFTMLISGGQDVSVAAFDMHPKITNITLNSFVFVMDILLQENFERLILHMKLVSVY